MNSRADSIARLQEEAPGHALELLASVYAPSNVERFLWGLHQNLTKAIHEVQNAAQNFLSSSEDEITHSIAALLRQGGLDATHDEEGRGHADLTVKNAGLSVRWICEAKEHRGYDDEREALDQLMSRMTTGTEPEGAILIYNRNQNAVRVQQQWQSIVQDEQLHDYQRDEPSPYSDSDPMRFRTIHKHANTGVEFPVEPLPRLSNFSTRTAVPLLLRSPGGSRSRSRTKAS